MRWDVFCRVIDNFGDIGVAWRLAADLAARGQAVRLWADDASALAWMAPQGAPGVELVHWREPVPDLEPQDVVVEAFGCEPPAAFVARMAARIGRDPAPPVWIDLEYLSAEPYVERSHGLSAQRGGLTRHVYFPGFTPATGGLLREPGLLDRRARFDRHAWLASHGIGLADGERVVSVFAYADAPLAEGFDRLDGTPTLLLLCAGASQAPARALFDAAGRRGTALRALELPWWSQADYDRLLWSCDLNLVRGEDSLVRAIWAGAPFIWHIYPQHDGVHAAKLEAVLALQQAGAKVDALCRAFNGLAAWPPRLPSLAPWRAAVAGWRDRLAGQGELAGRLIGFAAAAG